MVKLADDLSQRCAGVNLAAAFPGACSVAGDLAACVDRAVSCRFCLAVNAADDIDASCDELDNGLLDASCVDPRRCGNGVLEPGEQCDDGNTADGDCCAGDCSAEPAGGECTSDDNVCTDDQCDGAGFCAHTANSAPCDDGLFCNGVDTCGDSTCSLHDGDPCSGGAECNTQCNEDVDTCYDDQSIACTDDGNECTSDACDGAGACVATNLESGEECTDDANLCTDDICDGEGACTHPDNTIACDDGLFCTATDICSGGVCVGSGDPCAAGGECADNCNEAGDTCNELSSVPCTDDGNVCTDDHCDGSGACVHPNNTAPCNDGSFCNGNDTCFAGTCSSHAGNPCTGGGQCADICNEGPDHCFDAGGTGCDDGNACTTSDACNGSGTCVGGPAPNCDDGDVCTDDSCDVALGCRNVFNGNVGCNPLHVTSSGTGPGTQANPASLATALANIGSGETIKVAKGTYNISNEIAVPSNVTLEGGYDPAGGWVRNGAPNDTLILRSSANPDGGTNEQRLVAMQMAGRSGFQVRNLALRTANATGTSGMSSYGVHLSGCSNYTFTDVNVTAGNAASGANGGGGSNGANGSNGGNGGGGSGDPGGDAGNGTNGNNGSNGGTGGLGPAGSRSGGFWVPGGQASSGGDGAGGRGGSGGGGGGQWCTFCNDGAGNGGGAGGGGGQGATGGTGGRGGGSSYAMFLHSNGSGSSLVRVGLAAGSAGNGGRGGGGGPGGSGGIRGVGATASSGEIGEGGDGGSGGRGGNGGTGGSGRAGEAATLLVNSGTAPAVTP